MRSPLRWSTVHRLGWSSFRRSLGIRASEVHHRLDAVRAHLLERLGDIGGAIAHFKLAAARTASVAERNYLLSRAATLANGP